MQARQDFLTKVTFTRLAGMAGKIKHGFLICSWCGSLHKGKSKITGAAFNSERTATRITTSGSCVTFSSHSKRRRNASLSLPQFETLSNPTQTKFLLSTLTKGKQNICNPSLFKNACTQESVLPWASLWKKNGKQHSHPVRGKAKIHERSQMFKDGVTALSNSVSLWTYSCLWCSVSYCKHNNLKNNPASESGKFLKQAKIINIVFCGGDKSY